MELRVDRSSCLEASVLQDVPLLSELLRTSGVHVNLVPWFLRDVERGMLSTARRFTDLTSLLELGGYCW